MCFLDNFIQKTQKLQAVGYELQMLPSHIQSGKANL